LSAGRHHREAAGPRLGTAQSIAKELPLQLEKHMLPTVATVNHCRQRKQAHEHFVSLLWWHQPQRCGFACLAHRSLYDYSAEDAIKPLLTKRPSLRPWRHREYVLEALWMVEPQRCEWHRDFRLDAA